MNANTIDTVWIPQQATHSVSQWDECMKQSNPDETQWMYDPQKYYDQVCVECNYLDAITSLGWDTYLTPDAVILDMGCGGGWLSAYLSTFAQTKHIYALDSSRHFLSKILPSVVENMGGDASKITSVQGLFSPILLPNHSLDMVVSSSALHHAPSLEDVLKEARLALKEGGILMILNETPSPWWRYLARILLAFTKIFKKAFLCEYTRASQSISASGFLYDPVLGDINYPLWYWKKALFAAGFELIEVSDSGLATLKTKKGANLTHFICRAVQEQKEGQK